MKVIDILGLILFGLMVILFISISYPYFENLLTPFNTLGLTLITSLSALIIKEIIDIKKSKEDESK